jgi:hypothetical protein
MTGGRGVSKYCYKARGSADLCANRMAFRYVTFSASDEFQPHLEKVADSFAEFVKMLRPAEA